ncbi:hypothetical protein ACFL5E_02080 [Candidatus Omnitrophota bacterium]
MTIVLFLSGISQGQEEEGSPVDLAVIEMEVEFRDQGLTETEINNIEGPLKTMLFAGADAEDVKDAVTELKELGLKGRVLSDTVYSMSQLVSIGDSAKEAAKFVSDAAIEAMDRGISGRNLAIEIEKKVMKKAEELQR